MFIDKPTKERGKRGRLTKWPFIMKARPKRLRIKRCTHVVQ